MSAIHRFYCTRCDRYMYSADLIELAKNVNFHATAFHPADFAFWSATNITSSANYGAPPDQPSKVLPQYTKPYGTTSRSGSVLPALSESDKIMLAEAHILWD